jgi:hypothetical protein
MKKAKQIIAPPEKQKKVRLTGVLHGTSSLLRATSRLGLAGTPKP